MKQCTAIDVQARGLRRRAEAENGFLGACLVVGAFSMVAALDVLLRSRGFAPEADIAWAVNVGRFVGVGTVLAGGPLLWLYLVVGTCATLALMGRRHSMALVTRCLGHAFVFPLGGMVSSLVLWMVGAPPMMQGVGYMAAMAWGFVALAERGLRTRFQLVGSETADRASRSSRGV